MHFISSIRASSSDSAVLKIGPNLLAAKCQPDNSAMDDLRCLLTVFSLCSVGKSRGIYYPCIYSV